MAVARLDPTAGWTRRSTRAAPTATARSSSRSPRAGTSPTRRRCWCSPTGGSCSSATAATTRARWRSRASPRRASSTATAWERVRLDDQPHTEAAALTPDGKIVAAEVNTSRRGTRRRRSRWRAGAPTAGSMPPSAPTARSPSRREGDESGPGGAGAARRQHPRRRASMAPGILTTATTRFHPDGTPDESWDTDARVRRLRWPQHRLRGSAAAGRQGPRRRQRGRRDPHHGEDRGRRFRPTDRSTGFGAAAAPRSTSASPISSPPPTAVSVSDNNITFAALFSPTARRSTASPARRYDSVATARSPRLTVFGSSRDVSRASTSHPVFIHAVRLVVALRSASRSPNPQRVRFTSERARRVRFRSLLFMFLERSYRPAQCRVRFDGRPDRPPTAGARPLSPDRHPH